MSVYYKTRARKSTRREAPEFFFHIIYYRLVILSLRLHTLPFGIAIYLPLSHVIQFIRSRIRSFPVFIQYREEGICKCESE